MRSMVPIILLLIILTMYFVHCISERQNVYTYYFYLPISGSLTIVGVNQSSIIIYKLYGAEYTPLKELTVSRFEKVVLSIDRGFYKVVSKGRITIIASISELTTLYTSTEGGYVGKEFIIPRFSGDLAVHAFEDSEVMVYSADGKKLVSFKLWQNETKTITLLGSDIFRIVSSGRIAIGQHAEQGMMFMVDVRGKFRGRNLFGGHHSTMGVVVVSVYEPCKVRVHPLPPAKAVEHKFTEEEVSKNAFWEHPNVHPTFYWVVSDGDVTILVGEGEYNNTAAMLRGIAVAVIPANEVFRTFAPTALIVIPFKDGTIWVNGESQAVFEGQPIIYPSRGKYEIVADVPVTIEVIGTSAASLAESTAWRDGECLLSDRDIVDYGPPKPSKKPRGEMLPMHTIIIIIVVVAIVLGSILYIRHLKRLTP